MSKTIDYSPTHYHARGGVVRRLAVVCFALAVVFVVMGVRLSNASTVDHESFALVWYMLAVFSGGFATVVGLMSWIVRGRV